MTFATPIALAALVLVPILLLVVPDRPATPRQVRAPLHQPAAARERRRPRATLAASRAAAPRARVSRGADRRHRAAADRASREPRKEGTVILAIDRSGSMLATDVSPTRMAAARAAAATFVSGLPSGFKVGLVSFSDQADVVLPPTSDHEQAVKALTTLQADNGTALGDAITRSVDLGLTNRDTRSRPRARRSSCCCSRTARTRPVMRRRSRRRPSAAEQEGARLHGRARHGRRHDHDDIGDRRDPPLPGPAGSGDARSGRRDDRREVLRGCRRRSRSERLQQDRVTGGNGDPTSGS